MIRPEKLLFRQIFLDTAQLTRIVMAMPEVDEARVGVTGASQGGGLALACASLVPEVKRVAPVFPFLSDYKRVWQIDQAKDAYLELQDFFRNFDPSARARGRDIHQAWLYRRATPRAAHQSTGDDGGRLDGHRMPAFDAVRGL